MGRVSAKVPVRKLLAADDVYDRGFHKGNPGGLDAVDADLAAGNIADGVTIFGFLGTFAGGALAEDLTSALQATGGVFETGFTRGQRRFNALAESDVDLASDTQTFDANSIAVGATLFGGWSSPDDVMKIRLYMGGVQVAEGPFLHNTSPINYDMLIATRALSGEQIVKISGHNYDEGTARDVYIPTRGPSDIALQNEPMGGVLTGSIKS